VRGPVLPRRLAVEGAEGQGEGGPGGGALADPVSYQATEIFDAAMEEAAKAVDDFRAQQRKLAALSTAGRRAKDVVAGAIRQVQLLHANLARTLSHGLGLGGRAA